MTKGNRACYNEDMKRQKLYTFPEAAKVIGVSRQRMHAMYKQRLFKIIDWIKRPRYIEENELAKLKRYHDMVVAKWKMFDEQRKAKVAESGGEK